MSQESNEQQIRELASAVAHGAGGTVMQDMLRDALQPAIPALGIGKRSPATEAALNTNDDEEPDDEELEALDRADAADTADGDGFATINLLGETMLLFRRTKRLLNKVIHDKRTPINQKAQVANALANLLKGLASQQTDLYNAERLKRMENLMITTLRDVAPELQDEFMRRYEAEVNVL